MRSVAARDGLMACHVDLLLRHGRCGWTATAVHATIGQPCHIRTEHHGDGGLAVRGWREFAARAPMVQPIRAPHAVP